ncbi:efflux RND transporter permease subunit [Caminicella sporogenes]|uniref:efflux RND transporter permease subunit n=1 Tax=Caminicella sporogenes TaxID=166485 RepID=UPI0025422F95|nr:efflux RND transporter permease subunit [Caminicella sporogenes]WIF95982.1 efflux RND transporter permease subunit [Caminicella sporogenes]
MKISNMAVKRPVTILMMVFIILTLGVVSFSKLQVDLYPKIEVPVAIVMTEYDGVGPEEIENLITKPLEQSLSTVNNIKNIKSISSEGMSIVVVEFNFGVDMDFASLEMREKVDLVKRLLPDDAGSPMVMKIDPNAFPIIQIAFSNGGDLTKLQNLIEDKIQNRIERIEGVASVNISGGYEDEIRIKASQEKLNGYGISLSQIANIIRNENLNLPGGEVYSGDRELLLRTTGEFESIEEIKNLPIVLPSGGVIYLKDIAQIKLCKKDVKTINRMNGKPSINMSIQKESNANIVLVAKKVNKEIEKIKKEFPNLTIKTIIDTSEYINDAISNTSQNAILGGILAVFILYLFLRNIRSTFIIATSIPISIIATFTIMYFSGITINLMTLGGLALGIGMLVDNAIVVLENIYRFREEGYSRVEAAKLGAEEVGMAVLVSTLTTIAVFLPIVFTEGIASTLFRDLALTVTFSLLSSLLVSITLVPMLASKILRVEEKHSRRKFGFLTKIFDIVQYFFEILEKMYRRILKFSIYHRKTIIFIVLGLFVLSMTSFPFIGKEFFPVMDEGIVRIQIELPTGSSLEDTDKIAKEIEEKIKSIGEIDSANFSIGGGSNLRLIDSAGENVANVDVILVDLKSREKSANEVADEIREFTKNIPGAKIEVTASSGEEGMGGGTPISIEIRGDDLNVLKKVSDDFIEIVKSVEGTREVKSSFEEGKPEVRIKLKRKIASNYGLTAGQVASSVKSFVSGTVATKYKYNGTEIDVKIIGDEKAKESLYNLENLLITTPLGVNIPLGQVAEFEIVKGPVTINRDDQVRTVTITSQISGRDLGTISKEINEKLQNYKMPKGYEYKFGGEREEMIKAFKDLALALLLAILLVYMIMASQFESLLNPFIIMFIVPLAVVGGLIGLFITRRTLSVPSIIGIIMLVGIVVNNAIVLIDYINVLRKRGISRDKAVLKAGPTRLRPILMTTLTTVLGLLPLALGIGEGAEAQAPLATVVIFGLMLSTLLTLIFIPVLYISFDNFINKIKKMFRRKKDIEVI